MESKELHKSLVELREELRNTDVTDAHSRELLHGLSEEILATLERSEDEDYHATTLTERVNESIEHFETTHPSLTTVLNNVLNLLSNMGI